VPWGKARAGKNWWHLVMLQLGRSCPPELRERIPTNRAEHQTILVHSQVLQLKGLCSAFRSVGIDHVHPLRNKESIPIPTNKEFTRSSKTKICGAKPFVHKRDPNLRGAIIRSEITTLHAKNSRRGPKFNFNRDYMILYYEQS
jgi:hypothetical protein